MESAYIPAMSKLRASTSARLTPPRRASIARYGPGTFNVRDVANSADETSALES